MLLGLPTAKKSEGYCKLREFDSQIREEKGLREILWEHEPQASVSTAFSSSPKLSRVFL